MSVVMLHRRQSSHRSRVVAQNGGSPLRVCQVGRYIEVWEIVEIVGGERAAWESARSEHHGRHLQLVMTSRGCVSS
jgi:hypothetical protein